MIPVPPRTRVKDRTKCPVCLSLEVQDAEHHRTCCKQDSEPIWGQEISESVILSVHKERTWYDQQPTYVEIRHRNGNGNITMRPTERLVDERVFWGK